MENNTQLENVNQVGGADMAASALETEASLLQGLKMDMGETITKGDFVIPKIILVRNGSTATDLEIGVEGDFVDMDSKQNFGHELKIRVLNYYKMISRDFLADGAKDSVWAGYEEFFTDFPKEERGSHEMEGQKLDGVITRKATIMIMCLIDGSDEVTSIKFSGMNIGAGKNILSKMHSALGRNILPFNILVTLSSQKREIVLSEGKSRGQKKNIQSIIVKNQEASRLEQAPLEALSLARGVRSTIVDSLNSSADEGDKEFSTKGDRPPAVVSKPVAKATPKRTVKARAVSVHVNHAPVNHAPVGQSTTDHVATTNAMPQGTPQQVPVQVEQAPPLHAETNAQSELDLQTMFLGD